MRRRARELLALLERIGTSNDPAGTPDSSADVFVRVDRSRVRAARAALAQAPLGGPHTLAAIAALLPRFGSGDAAAAVGAYASELAAAFDAACAFSHAAFTAYLTSQGRPNSITPAPLRSPCSMRTTSWRHRERSRSRRARSRRHRPDGGRDLRPVPPPRARARRRNGSRERRRAHRQGRVAGTRRSIGIGDATSRARIDLADALGALQSTWSESILRRAYETESDPGVRSVIEAALRQAQDRPLSSSQSLVT